jgi:hypothetical protein
MPAQCADLSQAALEASQAYHDLLGALETAHIRSDTEEVYRLQVQVSRTVPRRDNALAELCQHQWTHVSRWHVKLDPLHTLNSLPILDTDGYSVGAGLTDSESVREWIRSSNLSAWGNAPAGLPHLEWLAF